VGLLGRIPRPELVSLQKLRLLLPSLVARRSDGGWTRDARSLDDRLSQDGIGSQASEHRAGLQGLPRSVRIIRTAHYQQLLRAESKLMMITSHQFAIPN
jgi:hypothetical protein